jgi:hypothetical protein
MLTVSPAVTGIDAGVQAVGHARLTGPPSEPDWLDDLYAALGVYTGLGAASPRTDEIARVVVAAITAAMLIERPLSGGSGPRLPDRPVPRLHDQAARRGMSVVPPSGRDFTRSRRALSGGWNGRPNTVGLTLTRTSALPADGQMCAVFAVDIVGFTRADRDDDIRSYLHQRLYEYLKKAFDDSGIPWAGSFCEDRGDGALVVIPPDIPARNLIDPLPERLRALVRRHNHVSSMAANMQLRAAAHIGPVEHDDHGFVGTDVNFAFRMLEARPLRRLLAESGAELGLVISDFVYDRIVRRHPSLVHPDAFRALRFQAKNTRARVWAYLPGATS